MWISLLMVFVCAGNSGADKIERRNASIPRTAEEAEAHLRLCFRALPKKLDAQFTVQTCPVFADTKKLLIYGLHTALELHESQCSPSRSGQFDCKGEISFHWVRFLLDNPNLRGEIILVNKRLTADFSLGQKTSESIPWDELPNVASIVMYEGTLERKMLGYVENCVKTRLDMIRVVVQDLLHYGPES